VDAVTLGSFRLKNPATYAIGQFYKNGTGLTGTPTNGGNTLNIPSSGHLNVGGHGGSASIIGDIAELLVFDRALEPWVLQKVEGYLAHKWGTQGTLPTAHAFDDARPTFGGSQTITFGALDDVDVTNPPFELEGYATSGLPLTYTSSNTSVATISGDTVTFLAVGTTTITANQSGDSHYTAAAPVTQVLTVLSKSDQTITFAMIDQGLGTTVTLDGTASSNLPLTYAITAGTSITQVPTAGQVKFTGLGSVTIRATQAGNNLYWPAAPVDVTFNVKSAQTITFQTIGQQGVGDTATLFAYTQDSVTEAYTGLPITFSVVTGSVSISMVNGEPKVTCDAEGNATIQALQEGNGTYAPVSARVSFNVGNLQGQEILFPAVGDSSNTGGLRNLSLGRKPFFLPNNILTNRGLTATLSVENLTPGQDLFTKVGNKLILKGAGKLKITATHDGVTNQYYAAAPVSRIIEIKPPGRGIFFEERRMDSRHAAVKLKFRSRMQHLRTDLASDNDAADAFFEEDSADSDGDGVSNLLERAFGMDSLGPDKRKDMPRVVKKGDDRQRITFVRFTDAVNAAGENIVYNVELSTDLRTWSTSGVEEEGTAVPIGGGMERVTFRTSSAVGAGQRQYLRLTVSSP
jgi:hypothetical protein